MLVRNITLLGHKDHGKSTLIGNLLILTGAATKVRINEAKAYSKKLHKEFEPAFILDSFAEEREQEMTYDTTRAEIKYKDVAFALIDVPGHEELIKNMISGASYGEVALLLVSAKKDEGIMDQTKRHLFISRMLGIDRLVVAVNKMDLVGYDKERFEEIREGLSEFIEKIGFKRDHIHFVPVSAYKGDNLVKKSAKMKWYKGKPALELLYENSKAEGHEAGEPLRLAVQGTLEGNSSLVLGRVIKGKLSVGENVSISPSGTAARVKEIIVKGKRTKSAKAGENVALQLTKKVSGDLRGSVIFGGSHPPAPKEAVKALIFVTKEFGKSMSIRFNGIAVESKGIRVLKHVDTTTGNESTSGKAEPLSAVVVEVKLKKRIPAESFSETRELGRFVLYSGNEFAGIGIVR